MTAGKGSVPHIKPLGESAVLVSLGDDVSDRTGERVRSLAERLRQVELPGVTEIVPAYNCVLVSYDQQCTDEDLITAVIHESAGPASHVHEPLQHIVPVRYEADDGPDLGVVAARARLDVSEVVRLHSNVQYTVAFLGFLPGFPYMQEVPAQIATPRRDTPRVSVPPGSVGIAARQTGIYPFNSPGGWQIIGRTPLMLWDALAPNPALFNPGDDVRFVRTDEMRVEPPALSPPVAKRPVFEVIEPGAFTSVQDFGRVGYAHLGVGPAGAFDVRAAGMANRLAGNPPGTALLEMTLTGAALRVLANTTFALAGADFCCRVNGVAVPQGISWFARAGSTIGFAGPSVGLRAYLAVAGGLDVPPVLGSRSTSAYGGFGGYAGRPLRSGDILGVTQPPPEPALLAGRVFPEAQEDSLGNGTVDVRYVPYQGRDSAGDEATQHFTEAHWIVSERTDRMGIRLSGNARTAGVRGELASFPVVQGAIQLPPDGQPIVLGPDHQTTGGYPLLGVVAECDRIKLAQARAGDKVRFSPIEREEARALAREADRAHEAAMRRLPPV